MSLLLAAARTLGLYGHRRLTVPAADVRPGDVARPFGAEADTLEPVAEATVQHVANWGPPHDLVTLHFQPPHQAAGPYDADQPVTIWREHWIWQRRTR